MEKALQYRSADNVSLASNLICLPAPLSECELVIDGDAEDERHNHSNGQHVHMIVTPSPERNQHNEKSKDAAVQSRRKLTPSPVSDKKRKLIRHAFPRRRAFFVCGVKASSIEPFLPLALLSLVPHSR
ncbi:hypothetical protein QR680_003163 [Steinernema hermaphroditum]|uniref:Uncharacterized protein n=1 Tax=Steinernema hermaphroditum TaxID=289476 RepID=A0AA39LJT7_9BILA|nr:hypothetical protein QR680_003163 [Steinernema hermaphroditum]